MKNVSVILNIVLVVAVAILFVLYFSGNGKSGAANTTNSQGDSTIVIKDIAYVQVDSLVNKYDLYHDLRAEFEKNAKQMDAEFTAKGRSFQKELQDYREKAEKGLITRSQAEQIEQNLQRRQADLEKTGQEMQAKLAEQERVMMNQIIDNMMKYINKYNETKKYSLILNTSAVNTTILYGHPSMNITEDIIKGLNEEYIQNRSNTVK